jgi:hypothetical protein
MMTALPPSLPRARSIHYLECNNRHNFDGQPGFKELYPDFTEWRDDSVDFVLPLVRSGEKLIQARAMLSARAGAMDATLLQEASTA